MGNAMIAGGIMIIIVSVAWFIAGYMIGKMYRHYEDIGRKDSEED